MENWELLRAKIQFEEERRRKGDLPALLDIVEMDGRWGQMRSGINYVNYLDTGEIVEIDWDDWQLAEKTKGTVYDIIKLGKGKFTEQEISRIHWSADQNDPPGLKLQVKVFGRFVKKNNQS